MKTKPQHISSYLPELIEALYKDKDRTGARTAANSVSATTEKRLVEWAYWAKRREDGGLGYPHRSVEGRLKEDGGVLPTSNYRQQVGVDEAAEEIEQLIVELGQEGRERADALKLEYLAEEPLIIKARRMRLSRSQFIIYRDLGKAWIDGRLCVKRRDLN